MISKYSAKSSPTQLSQSINILCQFLDDLRLEEIAECSVLLKELLVQVNADGNALAANIVESCAQWLSGRDSQSIVLRGFLKVLGTDISSGTAFAVLLEVSLNSYFKSSGTYNMYTYINFFILTCCQQLQFMSHIFFQCPKQLFQIGLL
jgi:hypothetical protein